MNAEISTVDDGELAELRARCEKVESERDAAIAALGDDVAKECFAISGTDYAATKSALQLALGDIDNLISMLSKAEAERDAAIAALGDMEDKC
jgi:hypothetical protein